MLTTGQQVLGHQGYNSQLSFLAVPVPAAKTFQFEYAGSDQTAITLHFQSSFQFPQHMTAQTARQSSATRAAASPAPLLALVLDRGLTHTTNTIHRP